MKGRFQTSSFIFFCLAALMLAVSIISFASAVSWINRPFPGFLTYHLPLVGSISIRDWTGPNAGLKFKDRVITVDGQPIREGQDLLDAVNGKKPGTPVRYVVESGGQTREVIVPVGIFSFIDFLLAFFITFLGGLILFALGVIVYLLKPNITSSWVFLGLCFSLGGYMITSFDTHTSYLLLYFHALTICLFPATFFHLGLIFPDRRRILTRWPKFEYTVYLPVLVLTLAYYLNLFIFPSADSLPWVPAWAQISSVVRVFVLFCVVSLIILTFYSNFKASDIAARQRARIILFGVTIAFLPTASIMFLVSSLKIYFPWNFMVFFIIFFPASIAYSIVRHNLFDADTIIRRTVGYFVVTAIVIGAYAAVSVGFNVFMGKYQLAQSKAFPISFTLGVILIFNPLRDRIQALVDRIFFRKEYDYGAIVENVSGAMTSLLDLSQILKRLTQTFIEDMFINTSSVMLLAQDGTQYQVLWADGEQKQDVEKKTIKRDEPLMGILEENKKELTIYDMLEDPKFREVSGPCAENFKTLRASLMVPLVYQNQVIGSLNLGEKKSGKFYNREDIDLLRTLAHQGAVAIENARLFQENLEKQRMEEELNIARDLQMSMLPSSTPQIKGFEIAAYSVSAREVGGDFYDFIDMGEEKAGIVIGDVTGKSVSGALVMSSSRSIFRMLSEDELTVAESMIRANRRIKKDVKTGMFVALLFAVLNSHNKTLTLCSAGQTLPLLLSAETAEAKLVETEGDTFPLGILDEASYEETQLQLEPGDRVALYTDGIVEAMNEQEEMFGFEKLQEVIETSKAETAEELKNDIVKSVYDFAGNAPQHDDITVIVLSVAE